MTPLSPSNINFWQSKEYLELCVQDIIVAQEIKPLVEMSAEEKKKRRQNMMKERFIRESKERKKKQRLMNREKEKPTRENPQSQHIPSQAIKPNDTQPLIGPRADIGQLENANVSAIIPIADEVLSPTPDILDEGIDMFDQWIYGRDFPGCESPH